MSNQNLVCFFLAWFILVNVVLCHWGNVGRRRVENGICQMSCRLLNGSETSPLPLTTELDAGEGLCMSMPEVESKNRQCLNLCVEHGVCEAFIVYRTICRFFFNYNSTTDDNPLPHKTGLTDYRYPEDCPEQNPYQGIKGHYCCKQEPNDIGCQAEGPGDMIPCTKPPCINHKTAMRVECPEDYPFPLNFGRQCCKNYLGSPSCNAQRLEVNSSLTCCHGGEYVSCPGTQCKEHSLANRFCPTLSETTGKHSRFGDTGFWIEHVTGIDNHVSQQLCEAKAGNMLTFRQSGALSHVKELLKEHSIDNPIVGIGLRRVNDVDPCTNDACSGMANWVDGSQFVWEPWMDAEVNIEWYVPKAICLLASMGPASGPIFSMHSRWCVGTDDHVTICEKSCLAAPTA